MSDMMRGKGPGADMMSGPVGNNMSMANPMDVAALGSSGSISPDMTIRDFFDKQGIDVDGPITQLIQYAQKTAQNASPMGKMKNIAADTALQSGGQPPTRPGVKPMVAPPGQPSPAGLEGLLSKLGGR